MSELPKYSLLPLLAGTLKVTIIAVLIAIPLAVLAALYTAEFAPPWARETIKPAIEILAGIPSVVVGFFCLMVLGRLAAEHFRLDLPPECRDRRESD